MINFPLSTESRSRLGWMLTALAAGMVGLVAGAMILPHDEYGMMVGPEAAAMRGVLFVVLSVGAWGATSAGGHERNLRLALSVLTGLSSLLVMEGIVWAVRLVVMRG